MEKLDLSDKTRVKPDEVVRTIGSAKLPKLGNVILKRLATFYPSSITMAKDFFGNLTGNNARKIKHMDVSEVSIGGTGLHVHRKVRTLQFSQNRSVK